MPDACCCYVIDAGYLFPTLVSAIQARAAIAVSAADVVIFCVGHGGQELHRFEPICRERGIKLVSVPPSAIDHMPIMFGRFYLSRLLDPHYEAIVYIDGDTQVSGSLQPLVGADLEPNRFLAVRDPMSIMIDTQSRAWRKRRDYFRRIGIGEQGLSRYCNSGVLRFNRGDWDAMSRAALQTSARHDHGLAVPRPGRAQPDIRERLPDDVVPLELSELLPVLRVAGPHHAEHLSFHVESSRPWNGPFRPWGRAWYEPYLALANDYPHSSRRFTKPIGRCMSDQVCRCSSGSSGSSESPAWRTPRIRERIMRFEAEAYV